MLQRLSARQRLLLLAEELEPGLRRAFLECVQAIRDNIELKRVIAALDNGNIQAAVDALDIHPDDFARFVLALDEAYNKGGLATVDDMPQLRDPEGGKVQFRWGVRNLGAEQSIQNHAATMIRDLVEDNIAGIRDVMMEGLAAGRNPATLTRQIVGAKNRVTGAREGGLIGLDSRQIRTVAWIRDAMRTGDVDRMLAYLDLKLRDRRFDRSVEKAIQEGKSLTAESAGKVVTAYSNRALDSRAKRIALHETFIALSTSQHDAYAQQIAAGRLLAEDVTKTWRHTPQERGRAQHIVMNGQTVAFNSMFRAPDGTLIRHPHAPGTPAHHTIGCKCGVAYTVNYVERLARRYRPN